MGKKQIKLPVRLQNELAVSANKTESYTTIKHFANLGDAIAALPAIKKYYELTKLKVIFCQVVNQPAQYYQGAVHPTVNNEGVNVCINDEGFAMMKPLLESQEYIHKAEKYEGQHIDIDFDLIRGKIFVGMPNLMIQSWIMYAYPDLACDLSKPWLFLPEIKNHPIKKQVSGKIILNFTQRYRSEPIDYFFLKRYAPDLIFAGTDKEHLLFCGRWQLNIPKLKIKDFLEYAYAIKYSRFLLGCQTFGWNISQALGTPRIVELCRFAPNVQPMVGANSYGYLHQVGAEYYFRLLYDEMP